MWFQLNRICRKGNAINTLFNRKFYTSNFPSYDFTRKKFYTVHKSRFKFCIYDVPGIHRRWFFSSVRNRNQVENTTEKLKPKKQFKKSEVKRLIVLMKPERWKLTGKFVIKIIQCCYTADFTSYYLITFRLQVLFFCYSSPVASQWLFRSP